MIQIKAIIDQHPLLDVDVDVLYHTVDGDEVNYDSYDDHGMRKSMSLYF
jgi:hypothetical protein